MTKPVHKGDMIHWNDDKGYGFIEPEDGSPNVFIHITALKKTPRRPVTGDVISYQISTDRRGKPKAVNAVIEAVRIQREEMSGYKKSGRGFKFIIALLIIISGFSYWYISKNRNIYKDIAGKAGKVLKNLDVKGKFKKSATSDSDSRKFECQGKTKCSEMTSCAEATFYLRNCPGVEIDGDGDGIPCERQLCSW